MKAEFSSELFLVATQLKESLHFLENVHLLLRSLLILQAHAIGKDAFCPTINTW